MLGAVRAHSLSVSRSSPSSDLFFYIYIYMLRIISFQIFRFSLACLLQKLYCNFPPN
uniref:Uncharacterized protein n=1 Tax=Oryza brachyantha TaxID=4533 RepID=J3KX54_ORYBR